MWRFRWGLLFSFFQDCVFWASSPSGLQFGGITDKKSIFLQFYDFLLIFYLHLRILHLYLAFTALYYGVTTSINIYKAGITMRVSYKKLWKMLIDRDMSKTDLRLLAGISSTSLAKLGKDESVTTNVLVKVCTALDCNIGDIMDISDDCKKIEKKSGSKNRLDNRCPLVHTILYANTEHSSEGE